MDVRDHFIQEENLLNMGVVIEDLVHSEANPWISLLNQTKSAWPLGVGDNFTTTILTNLELDHKHGEDWTPYNSENACCWKPTLLDYGSRTVTSCLQRYELKTHDFCKPALSFKHEIDRQLQQHRQIITNNAEQLWGHFLRAAAIGLSGNMVLNQGMGNPYEIGYFPNVEPTSRITWEHLKMLRNGYLRQHKSLSSPALMTGGRPYFFVICDYQTYEAIEEDYVLEEVKRGYQSNNIQEFSVVGVGANIRTFGNFMFVIDDCPRAYDWKDGSFEGPIPHALKQRTTNGWESVGNPDYTNARITETHIFNTDAYQWLVPPMKDSEVGTLVDPMKYGGEFRLIDYQDRCDPFEETFSFAARFVAGMHPNFPERALTIRHLKPQACPCDIDVCTITGKPAEHCHPIKEVCCRIEEHQIEFILTDDEKLPPTCPIGQKLVAKTQGGAKVDILQIIARNETGRNACYAVQLAAGEGGEDIAHPRKCDPWKSLCCISAGDQCDPMPSDSCVPCGAPDPADPCGCDGEPVDSSCPTACWAVSAPGASVDALAYNGAPITLGGFPYSDASAFEADVNAWLAGDGVAEVVHDGAGYDMSIAGTSHDGAGIIVTVDGADFPFAEVPC